MFKIFNNNFNLLKSVRNYHQIVYNRHKYLSPVLKTFEAYDLPFIIDKGKMQYIWDIEGNKYIDMVSQNIVVSVGHSHPKVISKVIEQINRLPHSSSMYYNKQSGELGKKLVEKLPEHPSGEDWVVHLVNSGSEAVDLAIQMAREYTGNYDFYALHKAYHGLQGMAAGLTAIGKSSQKSYTSTYPGIIHTTPNNIEEIENSLKFKSSGQVSGIIIEPLQGYGGIFPLRKNYMKEAFELVKKNNGITISDEVQTGYGRCGESFWGFEMENNATIPDMITIAKGMGNGCGIIGAVICRRSIAEAFSNKMFFNTYGANPVSCSAALGVLEVFEEDNILENSRKMGEIFTNNINKLCQDYPDVYKEIRGSGLFQGLEIYGKDNEESIENSIKLHNKTLKYGIVIGRGSAAGNVFRIQPPMCIEEKDVNYVIDVLEQIAIEFINNK
jgi:alanine-glyoxylate transaminase/(R)-3-amino-2-methylpropionate-pyruvate transaminase